MDLEKSRKYRNRKKWLTASMIAAASVSLVTLANNQPVNADELNKNDTEVNNQKNDINTNFNQEKDDRTTSELGKNNVNLKSLPVENKADNINSNISTLKSNKTNVVGSDDVSENKFKEAPKTQNITANSNKSTVNQQAVSVNRSLKNSDEGSNPNLYAQSLRSEVERKN